MVPRVDENRDELVIQVPSTLARDRILTRYQPLITDAMSDLGFADRQFDVTIGGAERPEPAEVSAPPPDPVPDPISAGLVGAVDPSSLDEAGLNPRYTFEAFVKGASNQFALAAASVLLERPVPARWAATAELRIPEVWSRFEGHFPAEPVLPAIAQLSDLVLPLDAALPPGEQEGTLLNVRQRTLETLLSSPRLDMLPLASADRSVS